MEEVAGDAAVDGAAPCRLGIERRHETEPPTSELAEVVLLDLPDHDSTASAHRAEVDRMVQTMTAAALIAAGYHTHRRQWRRQRGAQ